MKFLGPPSSGSQAGTTFSHNRAGQYTRNRRSPVTPTRTSRQTTLRSQFGSAATAYQNITQAQQAAWTAFAHSYPITDALGQSITLTGMQMFVAINTSLLNAGQVIITDPPTNVVVNPITPVTIYAEATGVFWVTWAPGTLGDFVLMAQSKLVSGGVSFNKTFTQVQASDASYGFFNFTSYFAAQWGAITTGRRVFARLTPVNSSGRSLPGVIVATTAVAGSALPIPVLAASVAGSSAVTWTGGTTANILVEESADGGVTWNVTATYPGSVTTQAVATAGAGNKFRVTLLEGSVFSRVSNVEAGS